MLAKIPLKRFEGAFEAKYGTMGAGTYRPFFRGAVLRRRACAFFDRNAFGRMVTTHWLLHRESNVGIGCGGFEMGSEFVQVLRIPLSL